MRARVGPGQTGQRDDAARASASARLPMFPETGPRVPLLELADVRGGPVNDSPRPGSARIAGALPGGSDETPTDAGREMEDRAGESPTC